MCDGECWTWDPAVLSHFKHSLACLSTLSVGSWQEHRAVDHFLKVKVADIVWGAPSPQPGGGARRCVRLKKHYVRLGPERLRDLPTFLHSTTWQQAGPRPHPRRISCPGALRSSSVPSRGTSPPPTSCTSARCAGCRGPWLVGLGPRIFVDEARPPQKSSTTFLFKKWSKTSNFGHDRRGALVDFECSPALTNIQNCELVF